jgi:hypothetical protein
MPEEGVVVRYAQRYCTVCGAKCATNEYRPSAYSRHVYGVVSEPRCSQECAEKPVMDTELLRTLEYMGPLVFAAKMAGLAPVTQGDFIKMIQERV